MKVNQVYAKGRGSLAGTTARIVDGVMILSERIVENKSKTLPQIFQRDKQSFVRKVADSVKIDIIDNFWFKKKPLTSGYSAFIGKNLDSQTKFVIDTTPFVPDKLALEFSRGSLEGINFSGVNSYKPTNGEFTVTWNPAHSSSGEDTDSVVVVLYQVNTFFPAVLTLATRADAGEGGNIALGLDVANLVWAIFAWRSVNGKLLISPTSTIEPTSV